MRKRVVLILMLVLLMFIHLQAEDSVLFIGNSLTFYNNMPSTLGEMGIAAGKDLFVDSATIGGASLLYLSTSQMVIDKINARLWDYIVLQSNDITAFPEIYHYEISTINTFKEMILANNPDTKIIYQMVWGFENGIDIPGEGYNSYEEYMDRIYTGTLHIAGETGLIIAPVGQSWRIARELNPRVELFAHDECHPSPSGSYLAACTFYSVIYIEPVSGNTHYAGLSASDAAFFQDVASAVVLENLALWNITQQSVNNEKVLKKDGIEVNCYPNPFNPVVNVSFDIQESSNLKIDVYDIKGRLVDVIYEGEPGAGSHNVAWFADETSSGVYFLRFTLDNQIYNRKVVLMK